MIKYRREQKQNKSALRRLLPLIISAAALLVLLVILLLIRKKESVAEWFTTHVSKFLVGLAGHITSVFPFSVYEWTLILAVAGLIALVVLGIIGLTKKKFFAVLKGLCIVVVVALSFGNLYTVTAGFAYYRSPLKLERSETLYKGEILLDIATYFTDDLNELNKRLERDEKGNVISPYTTRQLAKKLQDEYKRLDSDYFFSYTPRAKGMTNNWFMTSSGFTGVTFMPFGESNVNTMTPSSDLPATMAHELAHAKGVMRENEANLVSYYLLLTSSDPYLRYCGYFSVITSLYSAISIGTNFDYELADAFYDNIPSQFKTEEDNAFLFWTNYRGPFAFLTDFLDRAGRWFNNLYLKSNGAPTGEGSYQNPWSFEETPIENPDTGEIEIEYTPVYSEIHKIFFSIYENSRG